MKVMTKRQADEILANIGNDTDGCVAICKFADVQAAMNNLRDQDCIFFRCQLSGGTFVYFPTWRDNPLPDNQCMIPTPMLLKNYNTRENDYYIHHYM